MQLGFCSISALDRPLEDAVGVAAVAGFDAIEVTQRPPHLSEGSSLEVARAAGQAAKDAGLAVVAYGSYLGREGVRDVARARHEVALAGAMGAPRIRVWAEPLPGAPGEGFTEAVGLLQATCEAAADLGLSVVVERHAGSFADTAERIHSLFAAVDRAELSLNYQVLDFLLPGAIADQPADARELIPLASYFHLKNYQANPNAGDPSLPGGSLEGGLIDYRALLGAAFEAGYRGPLTLEFVSFEPLPLEEKLAKDMVFLREVLSGLGERGLAQR